MSDGLSRPAREVAARLAAPGRRRQFPLATVRAAFAEADPASAGSPDRRRRLAEVIHELVTAGVLEVSRTVEPGAPELPTQVTLVRTETGAARPAPVVWHPRLRDADGRPDPRGILRAVNGWLFAQRGDPVPVPLRERALEITGDEKAFDGGLGPVLTLDLLRAYRVVLPLHRERVGDGPVLLVVENSDTYDSLRRTTAADPGAVGEIGWGAGAAFESSVLSLRDRPPGEIRYFGDLDANGLRIPAAASALADEAGLPPVRPATALYDLLFAHGREQAGRPVVDAERALETVAWLDVVHRTPAEALLTRGVRLAQEAVGRRLLADHTAWRTARGG